MNADVKLRKAENGYIGTDALGQEHIIRDDLEDVLHWAMFHLTGRGPGLTGENYGRVVVVLKKREGE